MVDPERFQSGFRAVSGRTQARFQCSADESPVQSCSESQVIRPVRFQGSFNTAVRRRRKGRRKRRKKRKKKKKKRKKGEGSSERHTKIRYRSEPVQFQSSMLNSFKCWQCYAQWVQRVQRVPTSARAVRVRFGCGVRGR